MNSDQLFFSKIFPVRFITDRVYFIITAYRHKQKWKYVELKSILNIATHSLPVLVSVSSTFTPCLQKVSGIFSCSVRMHCPILVVFGRNVTQI